MPNSFTIMAVLKEADVESKLTASHFMAIGAVEEVTLGFFDLEAEDYRKTIIHEQVEALSLIGDISLKDADPQIHAHVVIGRRMQPHAAAI